MIRGATRSAFVLVALALCLGTETRAQVTIDSGTTGRDFVHFAFSAKLGSGIYDVGGRTVQIYRIPLSYAVRDVEERGWGVVLHAPVTIGIFDFKPRDVLDTGLPSGLDTVSVLTGVSFPVAVKDRWILEPFADIGYGEDLSGGEESLIYSAGLASHYEFSWVGLEFYLRDEIYLAGFGVPGPIANEKLLGIENGLDARRSMGFDVGGCDAFFSIFVASYVYVDKLETFRSRRGEDRVTDNYEVGVTFGTEPQMAWRKLKMPRLGLSYRFGDDFDSIRFVIGFPF